MGDHHGFDASGINWWSTARTPSTSSTSFDGSSASCSAAIADISPNLIDSSIQSSGFGIDWNQSLIGSSSGRVEPSFHGMLQEPFNYHPQVHIGNQDMINSQQFLLQGLFEPQVKPQQSTFDHRLMLNCEPPSMSMIGSDSNYHGGSPPPSDLLAKFPHFLKSSSPPKQQSSNANNLQFSNSTPFWNASYSDVSEAGSGFYPSSMPVQFSSATTKSTSETPQRKSEPASKKPRIEMPSPLPTFKVRKEKLGDRITALQQLVSPFGKTDTASVLHEAIEYIKFLHDQVNVLTTPYFKNCHPIQHQQSSNKSKDDEGPKQDLRSRGLCLVPIESTYPVATETTADFWTPTFGGSFR